MKNLGVMKSDCINNIVSFFVYYTADIWYAYGMAS